MARMCLSDSDCKEYFGSIFVMPVSCLFSSIPSEYTTRNKHQSVSATAANANAADSTGVERLHCRVAWRVDDRRDVPDV